MGRVLALLVLAGALLAGAPSAVAFTPKTRLEIARRAVTLMPGALARQLRRNLRQLQASAVEGLPAVGAGPAPNLAAGGVDVELVRQIDRAIDLLNRQAPMSQVAQVFGRIARIVTDLSFALNVGPADPRAAQVRDQFARYVEQKLPRMSLTFGGFAEPHLAQEDVAGFALATGAAARRDFDGILASYFPAGRASLPADFDDRSVAFASASLETSLALTSTARVWLYVWWQANGDLAGTPFLEAEPPESGPTPEVRPPASQNPQ